MNKEINVFSAFNGMGCIFISLEEVGISVKKRYSSEIEKYPNKANDTLYPDTEQLGDVRNVKGENLGFIDLIAGGSPCQSFSFAGKRKGMSAKNPFIPPTEDEYYRHLKEIETEPDFEDYVEECRDSHEKKFTENIEILTLSSYLELKEQGFEFEGQSYLFWEYIRILNEIRVVNPNVKFLLENVIMSKKWQKIITQAIGINPIRINSALVSAQNRDRLYWTNIASESFGLFGDLECVIAQPKDENILLRDILERPEDFESQEAFDGYMKKYFLSDTMIAGLKKHNENSKEKKRGFNFEPTGGETKAKCLRANNFKMGPDDNYILNKRQEKNFKNVDEKANTFLSTSWKGSQANGMTIINQDDVVSGTLRTHNDGKGFREVKSGKGGAVAARAREDGSGQNIVKINNRIRRLTPRECGRLQTIPERMLDLLLSCGIYDTQLYKIFGNGWNIKTINHILQYYANSNRN